MKLNLSYVLLPFFIVFILFGCNSETKSTPDNNQRIDTLKINTLQEKNDTIVYNDRRENLKLAIQDTLQLSKSYFFSSQDSRDKFLLTISPGLVKTSKANLQIITTTGNVIYTQSFDTFYFIRGIYEPNRIPVSGGQEEYDKYLEQYWKSLKPEQYQAYFENSTNDFFNNISVQSPNSYHFKVWEEDITDHDFLKEVTADSTIKLVDMICFDCDEGSSIIGFSKNRKKVITLLEHE